VFHAPGGETSRRHALRRDTPLHEERGTAPAASAKSPPLPGERGKGGEAANLPPASDEWPGGEAELHSTLQIGDADRLAWTTGILTVSDFRQKEIAGGGQGAPLAPYAEALLFAKPGTSRILLNIGGIANFTWLPPDEPVRRWISGDTGPGNTLIDRAVRLHFPELSEGFDRDGALAAAGKVDPQALAGAKSHPYFSRPFPKSTGPEEFGPEFFSRLETLVPSVTREHALGLVALCTRLTAETIADALRSVVQPLTGAELFASGGGAHNRTLMRWLGELLPGVAIHDSAALGIPPDAKEAVLFAVLANETLAGAGFPARDGSGRRITFGKISLPD
jgi:anhydro-N-acetylmuramic acid kinase